MMKNIPIETLHLIAWYSLVASWIVVFFISGFEMALSWMIFGAMYISMSDVGEDDMSEKKLQSRWHYIRRMFGYLWATLGVVLFFYYIASLLYLV